MTREDYIKFRNRNSTEPLYEYYKERWNKDNHNPFLPAHEFNQLINLWPGSQEAVDTVFTHYDNKFTVVKIQDLKSGRVLRYE